MSTSSLGKVGAANAGSNRYSYTPPRSAQYENAAKAKSANVPVIANENIQGNLNTQDISDIGADTASLSLLEAQDVARSLADKKNRFKDSIQADAALDVARYQILNDSQLAMLIHSNVRNQSLMILSE